MLKDTRISVLSRSSILKIALLAVFFILTSNLKVLAQENSVPKDPQKAYQELKDLGLSDEQIRKVMEKYGRAKFNEDVSESREEDGVDSDSTETLSEEELLKGKKYLKDSKKDQNDTTDVQDEKGKKGKYSRDKIKLKKKKDNELDSLGRLKKLPPGKIYGQDVYRNKNIKIYAKASEVNVPENYIIGSGDELTISIWGYSDYNESFRVSDAGFVTSKNRSIGRIYVKGLTLADVRKLLQKKFGVIADMGNSQSDVTVNYTRSITINVVGEVYYPGSYSMPAFNTAFNAVVAAYGPSDIGSVRNIYIRRGGKTIDSLDTYKFLMNPGTNNDVFLQNNDYVVVSVAHKIVKIGGEVKRPHTYELKQAENLSDLLLYCGGENKTAFTSNIQLYRYSGNRQILIDINLDSLRKVKGDFPLLDADSIGINAIPKGVEISVNAKGAFRVSGDYQLRAGDKVLDLINRAQGPSFNAYLDRGYIFHLNPDLSRSFEIFHPYKVISNPNDPENLSLQNKDIVQLMSKEDFIDSLKVDVMGEVRKPGELDFAEGMTLKDAVLMGGGLLPGAYRATIDVARIINYNEKDNVLTPTRAIVNSINITGDMNFGKEAENFKLQPYDQIFVRKDPEFEKPKTVFLAGEVKYPGKYALLRKDEKVDEIVTRAGGLTKYAFLDGVKMYRSNDSIGYVYLNLEGAINRPNSRFNQVMFDGDSIFIPKTMNLVQISGTMGNIQEPNVSAPFSGHRAGYYVRNYAGGFLQTSWRRKTYVIHANGIVRTTRNILGFIKVYPSVHKGSHIIIPRKPIKTKAERKPFDVNTFIEKTSVKITGLLTLYILALTIAKK